MRSKKRSKKSADVDRLAVKALTQTKMPNVEKELGWPGNQSFELSNEASHKRVKTESHYPLGPRGSHVQPPPAVLRVPLERVGAVVVLARQDAADDRHEEGQRRDGGQGDAEVGLSPGVEVGSELVGDDGLEPEVGGAHAERQGGSGVVDDEDARLLEVGHHAHAQACREADGEADSIDLPEKDQQDRQSTLQD